MSKGNILALFVVLLMSFTVSVPLQAQEINCASDDSMCLQRNTEIVCREGAATRNSCEAWLSRLENHPDINEVNWQLARGWVYMYLADFAEIRSLPDFGSVSETEARAYRVKAANIFMDAATRAPDNPDALMSLVATTDSSTERIRLLRKVVANDPGAYIPVESLVGEILARSTAATAYLEAAEILEKAYTEVEIVPKKWDLAVKTLELYNKSAAPGKAENFRNRLANDIHLAVAESEFSSASTTLEEKQYLLSTLCDPRIKNVFGAQTCLTLIDGGMQLLPEFTDKTEKQAFSEHLVAIMAMVADSFTQQTADQTLSEAYKSNIAAIIAEGMESAAILNHYANFLAGEQQTATLKRALEISPQDGDIRYRLALFYMQQAEWEMAIEHFRIARNYLPAWRLPYLEQQMARAESQMEENSQ